jgi:hypothetical protein
MLNSLIWYNGLIGVIFECALISCLVGRRKRPRERADRWYVGTRVQPGTGHVEIVLHKKEFDSHYDLRITDTLHIGRVDQVNDDFEFQVRMLKSTAESRRDLMNEIIGRVPNIKHGHEFGDYE